MVYIILIYFFFPETKGRTRKSPAYLSTLSTSTNMYLIVEEIGTLFGDDSHVASHWYGISEEEKQKIAENALQLTKGGRIPTPAEIRTAANEDDDRGSAAVSEKFEDGKEEGRVERVEGEEV